VKATLVVKETASSGKHLINGRLSYQACSANACFPPEEVVLPIVFMVVPQGTPTRLINTKIFESVSTASVIQKPVFGIGLGVGLWFTLLGIFIGGLALNLTPCVYPLIPITISYFGGRSEEIRGRKIIHGLLYMVGLACTNSALGLTAALSGGMLGSVLQNPLVLVVVAGILFLLGLSFFGLWEFSIPTGLTRLASKNFGGYFGTFFIGLTLGVVAAPCLGPFMLGLLTYVAQKGEPLLGFLYFFVLSIGMGLPLAMLGIFTGAVEKLPISGEWMVWVRKVFGWVLLGMAIYIIMPLIPSPLMKPVPLSLILIAAGIHLGWLDKSRSIRRVFFHIKKGVGMILVIGAILFFVAAVPRGEGIKWFPYETRFVQEAKEENRPVILDFYADWCGPCRTMEKRVFRNSAVVSLGKEFMILRIDLTKSHPYQERLQEKYQIRGVPTIIFLNRQGIEEMALRIESYVRPEEVIRRMETIVNASE
jgi:thiol:disulfide interchange protein DsbD